MPRRKDTRPAIRSGGQWVEFVEPFAWHPVDLGGRCTIWFQPGIRFVKREAAALAIEAGKATPAKRQRTVSSGQAG